MRDASTAGPALKPISSDRLTAIVAALEDYDGDDIWQDVILPLPEYSDPLTDRIEHGSNDCFALADGHVIDARNHGHWQVAAQSVDEYL